MKARFVYENGCEEIKEISTRQNDSLIAFIHQNDISSNVKYIDFAYDFFTARTNEPGYFITDSASDGTVMTRFQERSNEEVVRELSFVACFGWKRKHDGILGIVTGMRYDFGMVLGVKDGHYYTYPRFYIDGDRPYEDIVVKFYSLSNGSYSEMARKYREFQLTEGGCIPLKERVQNDKRLKKAVEAIEVRVRQAWKPAPSPVENQTPETEPALHVACTFDRMHDVADEFHRQNIDKAEFCCVGWNRGGHDGRFPQLFPVEPQLGGEERLKAFVTHAKTLGYSIVCHDDATAAYTIADCFDEEYLVKNKDGSIHKRNYCWSGGRPHKICPQRQYERFELENQQKILQLGFEGLHYIDVITILPLVKCYDSRHPVNRKETAEWYKKIMKLSRENFGGFASESGFDFGAAFTDYVLYPAYKIGSEQEVPLCDRIVPFWHMVYHGIILYNPCTFTLNYMAKGTKNRLKFIELGGRPLACYYANFAINNHWMGKEDFLCDTEEQLRDSVSKIKQMADDYELLKPERYEFMEEHEEITDGVYRTVYSNGTCVTVDYNRETFEILRNPNDSDDTSTKIR